MRTLTDQEMNMIATGLRSVVDGCKKAQRKLAVHGKFTSASVFEAQAEDAKALAELFDQMPRVAVEQ